MKLLELAGLGFIGWLIAKNVGKALSDRVTVENVAFHVGTIRPEGLEGTVYVTIKNNTPVAIPVKGLQGRLMYGSYPISAFQVRDHFILNALEETEIPLEISVELGQIVDNVATMIGEGDFLNVLRAKGRLFFEAFVYPFDQKISIV